MSSFLEKFKTNKKFGVLTLAALGVVYGDIGTSPLYAINTIFFGFGGVDPVAANIYGCISLVIWALTLIIAIKYIVFVLRADNDGEGGVFALFGLLKNERMRGIPMLLVLLIFAAGLLFGNGLITPAISVLAAVEGLNIAAPALQGLIVPITITILIFLFSIQRRGTARIGKIFGPIILLWFIVIALLGASAIAENPEILHAFNPWFGMTFILQNSFRSLLAVLAAVMLTITGGEALYANMGHFGRVPIRLGWFLVVYPALILNYLGQGAYLLSGRVIVNHNIFYSMVPPSYLFPMIILAAAATIIASQALISGGFSLAMQAASLGLFPRLRILHTHKDRAGQIYIPFINWSLFFGCVFLVLIFRSSAALASAYGLAVSLDMLISSLAMIAAAYCLWQWSALRAFIIFGAFAIAEGAFFLASSAKFFQGGFIPVGVGLMVFGVMSIWQWGRNRIAAAFAEHPAMTVRELVALRRAETQNLPRSIVFMNPHSVTSARDRVPPLLQVFWERNGILPRHIILLTVIGKKSAYVGDERYAVKKLWEEEGNGSIMAVDVNFGFMENPNVERILEGLADHRKIHISEDAKQWLIRIVQERVIPAPDIRWRTRIKLFFFALMLKNSDSADDHFGLGNEVGLSTEIIPVKIS
ncbi:MAG: KUP/HAK/KT family potassium transporter [Candidatus Sungiibacteriota bacterium]